MSNYLIDDGTLTDIADAIRTKTGGSSPILTEDMATEIAGISGGGCVIDGESISEELSFGSAYVAPLLDLTDNLKQIVACQKVDGRLFYLTSDHVLHYNNPNGTQTMSNIRGICRHNGKLYVCTTSGTVGYLTYNTSTLQYTLTSVGSIASGNSDVNMCCDSSGNVYVVTESTLYDVTNNRYGTVVDTTYTYAMLQLGSVPMGIYYYNGNIHVVTHCASLGQEKIASFTVQYNNALFVATLDAELVTGIQNGFTVCSCDITDDDYIVFALAQYDYGAFQDSMLYVSALSNYSTTDLTMLYLDAFNLKADAMPAVFTYDADILHDSFGLMYKLDSLDTKASCVTIVLIEEAGEYLDDGMKDGIPAYYSDYQR